MQQPKAIHDWYEDHAHEFADADVIEVSFVGKSAEFQDRLNRFKLWAVDHGGAVDLAGKHVLEFGGGHGRLALAHPDVASYTGVDYSRNLVNLGNQRLQKAGLADRAELVYGDVASYGGPKWHYDIVCSLGMMCYFRDPEPVAAVMERFLKPGGVLFFDFRCASWLYSPIRRVKRLLQAPTGGTTYLASPKHVEQSLTRLGLTDVRVLLREFPLLAEHYSNTGRAWPLKLRNALAEARLARSFATEAWVFARKPAQLRAKAGVLTRATHASELPGDAAALRAIAASLTPE